MQHLLLREHNNKIFTNTFLCFYICQYLPIFINIFIVVYYNTSNECCYETMYTI